MTRFLFILIIIFGIALTILDLDLINFSEIEIVEVRRSGPFEDTYLDILTWFSVDGLSQSGVRRYRIPMGTQREYHTLINETGVFV